MMCGCVECVWGDALEGVRVVWRGVRGGYE